MKWQVIRLELASSWRFPRGSAGRSYLIRLPLTDDGAIDTAALESQPARATVRRYWPNEADMVGYLVHTQTGYAIRNEVDEPRVEREQRSEGSSDQRLVKFGPDAIKIGAELLVTEPDGHQALFRIAGLQ